MMFSVIKHGSPNRRNVCSAVSLRLIYLFAFLCLIALLIHLKRSRGQNMEEIEKQLTDIFPLDDENIPAQLQHFTTIANISESHKPVIDNYEVPLLSTLEPDIERVQTVTPLIAGEKNATHLKRKRLRFDPRILREIVSHGDRLSRRKRSFIYVLLFNHAYRYLVSNWLCNTAHFRTVHERLLLVSLSKDVCKEITEEAQQATCVEAAVKGYDDPADYATDTFDAIMLFRAHLSTLFAMRSVKVVMVEADATWFRNPQSIFANEFVNDGVGIVTPRNGGISMGAIRAMSPMVIRPTSTTWKFLRGLARRLERSSAQNDQAVYNVLCSSRYLEQRCGIFYYEDIADGIWLSILQTCSLQY
ncbi:hypothetical protein Y032_0147g2571 [Ancylostoma ceylanicum]|uniref:Nucleotide-diphospho-sugar transferase domain-containing protein n=1 Tax=Ancylostoma ceylanicum TaxID=53326 RepID=A0A016T207_9BILA|nr:hypothetical protein Y032_0147g2571 [Ancylostoma ceylanicum]